MSKEALKKLAGIFQEEYKHVNEKNNPEHELGGEFWYE